MNCIIIEDQPPAQRILKKYIKDIGSLNLKGTFPDALEAMDYLKFTTVDLIFLDIHLPKLSGLDFLKAMVNPPAVILTTAFPNYALESYELDVVDYLLKPFSFQRFVKAISKLKNEKVTDAPLNSSLTEIFIKAGYEHIRIQISDIILIKSDGDYTEIHTHDKKHLSNAPLRHWLDTIHLLVQVHKSYLINPAHISKVSANLIYLYKDHTAPIGRAYKEAFVKRFLEG